MHVPQITSIITEDEADAGTFGEIEVPESYRRQLTALMNYVGTCHDKSSLSPRPGVPRTASILFETIVEFTEIISHLLGETAESVELSESDSVVLQQRIRESHDLVLSLEREVRSRQLELDELRSTLEAKKIETNERGEELKRLYVEREVMCECDNLSRKDRSRRKAETAYSAYQREKLHLEELIKLTVSNQQLETNPYDNIAREYREYSQKLEKLNEIETHLWNSIEEAEFKKENDRLSQWYSESCKRIESEAEKSIPYQSQSVDTTARAVLDIQTYIRGLKERHEYESTFHQKNTSKKK